MQVNVTQAVEGKQLINHDIISIFTFLFLSQAFRENTYVVQYSYLLLSQHLYHHDRTERKRKNCGSKQKTLHN